MGESGSGKTTALRNLPPDETFYIDADGKGLSWKGWKKSFSVEKQNYIKANDPVSVLQCMNYVDQDLSQKKFKYIVIDTLNSIMIADEMRRQKEKGYDKWVDLAQSVYTIVTHSNELRDDLTVIMLAHTQTDTEDDGYRFIHLKTNGKKLNKICLESFMTTVLLARKSGEKYILETTSNHSSAKSPLGAFADKEIENDIMPVLKALEEY
jgi:hypothetical protein